VSSASHRPLLTTPPHFLFAAWRVFLCPTAFWHCLSQISKKKYGKIGKGTGKQRKNKKAG